MKKKISYIKSAVYAEDYPAGNKPEIIVAGRSNAGKSSFLNTLSKDPVAKVSQVPGKTRLLNFFDVDDKYRFVDTPGYGFSRRSGDEQASWQEMLEDYFAQRSTLCGVLLLMDCRREWEKDERMMTTLAQRLDLPVFIILTKSDKLRTGEKKTILEGIRKKAQIEKVFLVSCLTGEGIEELEDDFFRTMVRPHLRGGGK